MPDQFEPSSADSSSDDVDSGGSRIRLQRDRIKKVLDQENGNKSAAARIFGVKRRKLYLMMKQHGIEM